MRRSSCASAALLLLLLGVAAQRAGAATVIELGQASVDATWVTVNTSHSFVSPVVVAQPPTRVEGDPAVVRVRNVTATSFELQLQEPSNEDGVHAAETVSWAVFEAGAYVLTSGRRVEAGTFPSNATVGIAQGSGCNAPPLAQVSFAQAFGATPLVLSQAQTADDATFVHTRQCNVGSGGFRVALEREEGDAGTHGTETLGWVALAVGAADEGGIDLDALLTGDSVTDSDSTVTLNAAFAAPPLVLAQMQTRDGNNSGWVRRDAATAANVVLHVQEDTTNDAETNHTTERVGVLAASGPGTLSAPPLITLSAGAAVPAGPLISGAPGSQELFQIDLTVSAEDVSGVVLDVETAGTLPASAFSGLALYRDVDDDGDLTAGVDTLVAAGSAVGTALRFPVGALPIGSTSLLVVGSVLSGSGSVSFRVENAGVSGAGATSGDLLAAIGGPVAGPARTVAANPGLVIGESGRIAGLTSAWVTVDLRNSYTDPVIVVGPAFARESDPVVTRVRGVTGTSFQVRLQEPGNTDGVHGPEEIAYLVIDAGRYVLPGNVLLEAGTLDTDATRNGSGSADVPVSFSSTFPATPAVVSQVMTENDGHFVASRHENLSPSGFEVFLEQDEASPGPHGTETVGWIALQAGVHSLAGRHVEAGLTPDAVDDAPYTRTLTGPFASDPFGLLGLASFDGPNVAHMRMVDTDAATPFLRFFVEEETVGDGETDHTTEVVAYLAVDGPGDLHGDTQGTLGMAAAATQPSGNLLLGGSQQPLYSFAVSAGGLEGATGLSLTIRETGSHDPGSIQQVRLFSNPGGDPTVGAGDVELGAGAFSAGALTFSLPDLARNETLNLLVTFDLDDQVGSAGDTYGVRIENADLSGTGVRSGAGLGATGGPLVSPTLSLFVVTLGQEVGVYGSTAVGTGWTAVALPVALTNPVVIVGPASATEADEVVVRVRNVTASGFEARLVEAPNRDGVHGSEEIGYLAVAEGEHTLVDGTRIEARRVDTQATVGRSISNLWLAQSFTTAFGATPAVLASIDSANDPQYADVRMRQLTASGFQFAMEDVEGATAPHGAVETLGWVAWTAGVGSLGASPFEAALSADTVDERDEVIAFTPAFAAAPTFLSQLATYDGPDSAHLRLRSKDASQALIFVEEDTANDADTNHTDERVTWLALEGAGVLKNDLAAPDPVDNLRATPGAEQIRLDWTNPSSPGFVETVIRFNTTGFPATPSEGFPVEGGVFPNGPGTDDAVVHNQLEPGTTYYYSVWARSAQGVYSVRRTVAAQPAGPAASFRIELTDVANDGGVAGRRHGLRITALDASGAVAGNYAGPAELSWSRVSTGVGGVPLELGDAALGPNDDFDLDFADANGVRLFEGAAGLRYADVGLVRLRVADRGDAAIAGEAVLTFRPLAFEVRVEGAEPPLAGDDFALQVRAVAEDATAGSLADNPTTPSYATSGGALVLATEYVSPNSGAVALTPANGDVGPSGRGEADLFVAYGDAGTIRVQVTDPAWFGQTVTGSSDPFEVFPHHFDLVFDDPPPERSFFYAVGDGEPFAATVTARNAAGATTANYRGTVDFAPEDASLTVPGPMGFGAADAGSRRTAAAFRGRTDLPDVEVVVADTGSPASRGTGRVSVRFPRAAIRIRDTEGPLPRVPVTVAVVERESTARTIREDISTRFDIRILEETGGSVESSARLSLDPTRVHSQGVRVLRDVRLSAGGRVTVFVLDSEPETVTLAIDSTDPPLVPVHRGGVEAGEVVLTFGGLEGDSLRVLDREEENAGGLEVMP